MCAYLYFGVHTTMYDKLSREQQPAVRGVQREAGWHSPDVIISKDWFVDLVTADVKALYNEGARHCGVIQLSEENGHVVFHENYII